MALDPLTAVVDFGTALLTKLFPDPTERDRARATLEQLRIQGDLQALAGQLSVNQEEARNPNWFVAGGRPFCIWVAGSGFAYQFLLRPLLEWGCALASLPIPPAIDIDSLQTLLYGLLGLGAARTFEKFTKSEGNR